MIDVSDETTRALGQVFADAVAKVKALSYTDRRRLAVTSDDETILIVLSEATSDDSDATRLLLENPHTPPTALKKIVEHCTAETNTSETTRYEDEDLTVTKDENTVLAAMKHQKADVGLLTTLSKNFSWHIRYGVAMHPQVPQEILKELAGDANLAIRAMASKRLGLPAVDEHLEVKITCSELNQTFEKICKNLSSSKKLADALAKKFRMTDDEKYDYSGSDAFYRNCVEAIEELRSRVAHRYMAIVRAKYLPNLDLSSCEEKIPKLMEAFGPIHFDAYIMATKLKELIDQRSTLSLSELLEQSQKLLPYVHDGSSSYSSKRADKPEHILDGKRLKLRAYFSLIGAEYSSIDYKVVQQVESLDQFSTVILTQADPATVRSNVSRILANRTGSRQIFQKIVIDNGATGLLAVRFYKNGNFIAEYGSAGEAEKVAKALVATPPSAR